MKYKKVVSGENGVGYAYPQVIEFVTDNCVLEFQEVLPTDTHRKQPVFVYKCVSPEFIKVGDRTFRSTKFGNTIAYLKNNLELFTGRDYVKLYFNGQQGT
jgi:hypothetical protein